MPEPLEAWVVGAPGLGIEVVSHVLCGAGVLALKDDQESASKCRSVVVLVEPSAEHWSAARSKLAPIVVVLQHFDTSSVVASILRGADAVVPADHVHEELPGAMAVVVAGGTLVDPKQARALACAARASATARVCLTPREREIIASIASGSSVKQTARHLGIAPKTVENLQGRLYRKLDVRNRAQAVARAHMLGLLDPPA